MDVQAINLSGPLAEAIQLGFQTTPVMIVQPVLAQFVDIRQRDALCPLIVCLLYTSDAADE